jgi:hypothetical protein
VAFGDVISLLEIPYLSKGDHSGRFLASPTFFDGGWRMWMQTEGDSRFIEVHAWPAEALYFSAAPEQQSDICSEFLDFLGQRANRLALTRTFSAIKEDICNLGAALAKLSLIHGSENTSGSARMAATQVEYILLVSRSIFDLLQEVIKSVWETVRLFDGSKLKSLKKSFAEMTLRGDEVRTVRRDRGPISTADVHGRMLHWSCSYFSQDSATSRQISSRRLLGSHYLPRRGGVFDRKELWPVSES